MKAKKITAALLLAALLTSASACADAGAGVSPGGDASGAAETGSAASESSAVATTEPAPKLDELDYKGKDFTIASHTATTTADVIMYSFDEVKADSMTGDLINDAVYERNAKVSELYDLTVKQFSIGPSNQRGNKPDKVTNSILAGDDAFQAMILPTRILTNLCGSGNYIVPLNEIGTLDLSADWWNQNAVEAYTMGGKLYFVTGDLCFMETLHPMCYLFNKRLYEDYKFDDPYKLVRDGKWTIEKVSELVKAVSRDLDGDGTMDPDNDQWGLMTQKECLWYWAVGCGISGVKADASGKPTLALDIAKSAKLVEELVTLFGDKKTTLMLSDKSKKFTSTPLLFAHHVTDGNGLLYYNCLGLAADLRDKDGDFGLLPVPKYDEKQDTYNTMASTWYGTNILVPMTNKDTSSTGSILDALGYYSMEFVTPAVMDVTITGKSLRDTESEEMLPYIIDGMRYDMDNVYSFGVAAVFNDLAGKLSIDFTSAWAAKESAIKAKLDDAFATK